MWIYYLFLDHYPFLSHREGAGAYPKCICKARVNP